MEARAALTATLTLAASCAALVVAPGAGATTYNNDAPITINTGGTATPYPSSITVSGTAGPITDVNVGLDGLSHTVPDEVAIALVAPSGQSLLLQHCVGDGTDAAGVFITFDDAAAAELPNAGALANGTFQPTAHCAPSVSFPAPGPLASYGNPGPASGGTATFASTFNGLSAIGTWNLYVLDRAPGDGGTIPGGWSLDVKPDVTPLPPVTPITTPITTPAPATKCKKKKKKAKKRAAAAGCKKKKKKK